MNARATTDTTASTSHAVWLVNPVRKRLFLFSTGKHLRRDEPCARRSTFVCYK